MSLRCADGIGSPADELFPAAVIRPGTPPRRNRMDGYLAVDRAGLSDEVDRRRSARPAVSGQWGFAPKRDRGEALDSMDQLLVAERIVFGDYTEGANADPKVYEEIQDMDTLTLTHKRGILFSEFPS